MDFFRQWVKTNSALREIILSTIEKGPFLCHQKSPKLTLKAYRNVCFPWYHALFMLAYVYPYVPTCLFPLFWYLKQKTWMNLTRKSRIKFLMVLVKVSHLTLVIWWKKIRFTRAIAANTRETLITSKHTFEITYNYFPCNFTEVFFIK